MLSSPLQLNKPKSMVTQLGGGWLDLLAHSVPFSLCEAETFQVLHNWKKEGRTCGRERDPGAGSHPASAPGCIPWP